MVGVETYVRQVNKFEAGKDLEGRLSEVKVS